MHGSSNSAADAMLAELEALLEAHGFETSRGSQLEGRSGEVFTATLLAEQGERAILVECADGAGDGVLEAAVAHRMGEIAADLGAEVAVLWTTGPIEPAARTAGDGHVVIWDRATLARLLGEASIARATGSAPPPLPLAPAAPGAGAGTSSPMAEVAGELLPGLGHPGSDALTLQGSAGHAGPSADPSDAAGLDGADGLDGVDGVVGLGGLGGLERLAGLDALLAADGAHGSAFSEAGPQRTPQRVSDWSDPTQIPVLPAVEVLDSALPPALPPPAALPTMAVPERPPQTAPTVVYEDDGTEFVAPRRASPAPAPWQAAHNVSAPVPPRTSTMYEELPPRPRAAAPWAQPPQPQAAHQPPPAYAAPAPPSFAPPATYAQPPAPVPTQFVPPPAFAPPAASAPPPYAHPGFAPAAAPTQDAALWAPPAAFQQDEPLTLDLPLPGAAGSASGSPTRVAASRPVLPVRLSPHEAAVKANDRLFGVTRHELVLQPVHLFDYECDVLRGGSLRSDTAEGRIQVHGTDKSATDVDPDQVNPDGKGLPVQVADSEVHEKVLRVQPERAQALALEAILKLHTRTVDVSVPGAGSYAYTEKRKVAPLPEHVRLTPLGIHFRPVWRLHGTNGHADVDAIDGRVVESQVRNGHSDAVILD